MAEDDARVYGGRWREIRSIGKGGQGVVYEVKDARTVDVSKQLAKIKAAVKEINGIVTSQEQSTATIDLVNSLREVIKEDERPSQALKVLWPIDEEVNEKVALDRMKAEIEAMRSVEHPSLVRVLDESIQDYWFVMEYFPGGPLSKQPRRYEGGVLEALKAFRPIVEAVSLLHKNKIVHRDIKWDNIFIRGDGRLVLGDCGLAIKLDDADRVTDTYAKVGSTAWMPVWAYAQRLENVEPNFEVFCLAAMLWCMVAGRPPFPIWKFDKPEYDLRKKYPDSSLMSYIHRVLEITVVEEAEDCIPTAEDMLHLIEEVITALEIRGQMPSRTRGMQCMFCGIGRYERLDGEFRSDGFANSKDRQYWYRCYECGHIESFLWRGDRPPNAWGED